MSGYYLLDHPPRRSQYRRPRREKWSGLTVLHTAEGHGALAVARYIVSRDTAGSYHVLHDHSPHPSALVLLPDDAEAFHVAVDGVNRFSVGESIACRSVDLHPDKPETWGALDSVGRSIALRWERHGIDPHGAARWLNRDQALARQAGLINHGTLQNKDRSDAWARHPFKEQLDRMLIEAILRHASGAVTEPEETEDMGFVCWDGRTGTHYYIVCNEANIITAEDSAELKKWGKTDIGQIPIAWLDVCHVRESHGVRSRRS